MIEHFMVSDLFPLYSKNTALSIQPQNFLYVKTVTNVIKGRVPIDDLSN